ncbi:hypothetical protein E4P82_09545 [Candidatus Competibacter phosphatis]|uniref:Uncharacterized protein n=1 Tax=Candidatus Competibacter phosphatis TaxID=221280 RepID=A0ABX1TN88_9GAMM|nr:hypothetical protein [Candidatus Competibacter phosphatis]NMQ19416.1 hypothetical protein [Candidatus Competibacter phosphatis]
MKTCAKYLLSIFVGIGLLSATALAMEKSLPNSSNKDIYSMAPVTNNGKKWRIAYYEGGPFTDYQQVFY